MTTHEAVVHAARYEIGTVESPAGSNCNPYSHELGRGCHYWCADFTVAILKRCGVPIPPGGDTSSTRANQAAWKRAGQWVAPADIQAGDVVFEHVSDRNGSNRDVPSHTEIAVGPPVNGHLPTVGGNTSSDDHGSQDNGGGVYAKTRPLSVVIGAGRPDYTGQTQGEFDLMFLYHVTNTTTTCLFIGDGCIAPNANFLSELRRLGVPEKETNAAFHNFCVDLNEAVGRPGPGKIT